MKYLREKKNKTELKEKLNALKEHTIKIKELYEELFIKHIDNYVKHINLFLKNKITDKQFKIYTDSYLKRVEEIKLNALKIENDKR